MTFDTGVDQTLGGYVHIKINCGTSRSQLVPGHASTNSRLTAIKDGDYYSFVTTSYEVEDGWIFWPFIRRYRTVTTSGYQINDGSESYYDTMTFIPTINLIFKMFAPATNTFASNSQGTNLWATTLPGGVSD